MRGMSSRQPQSLLQIVVFAFCVAAFLPAQAIAQVSDADLQAIATWVAVDAATGYEPRTVPAVAAALGSNWRADAWGNLISTVGSGTPHHVVACALDRPAYAISQITNDGFLRVHRIGSGSRHPLWDQQFEANQVRILTTAGPVPGVGARSNGHFAQQHREDPITKADDLWIDVGASSKAEVDALGIALLDPIVRHIPAWPIAGGVAGPDAGRRVGCAAVAALASAARAGTPSGRVTFVMSAQEVHGWVGLSGVIARADHVDRVTILAPGAAARAEQSRAADTLNDFGAVLGIAGVKSVSWLAPAVEQPGSHMEVVKAAEITWLLESGAKAVGVSTPQKWIAAPSPAPWVIPSADHVWKDLSAQLTDLAQRYGVSGHEWSVRRTLLEALPAWARDKAMVDDVGNIMVEAGPQQGEATIFMAHTDEVGYLVDAIAADGTVTLKSQGGAVASAWEGQTALLHFDPADAPSTLSGANGADASAKWKTASLSATAPPPLKGVFRIRATADKKDPTTMQAWFGLDGAALAARGVKAGMQVTNYKEAIRLGRSRFTSRSMDDRAGSTALMRAVKQIDPTKLTSRVIFTWSVHEEGGLLGAKAMARRYARNTARIYSIDTFVSSDTPLESPHFAYAPLGQGPVLRAIESSSVVPDRERVRIRESAKAANVSLQTGLTQGGTDGSSWTYWGVPNQALSWPGRYSHSPGEVSDLRDIDGLSRLIAALAIAAGR